MAVERLRSELKIVQNLDPPRASSILPWKQDRMNRHAFGHNSLNGAAIGNLGEARTLFVIERALERDGFIEPA